MTYALASQGVFWTIQGEGALMGVPMAFVRFAGCSVGCVECDTDYRVAARADIETLLRQVQAVVPAGFRSPWVWLTGGEPTDQPLEPLIDALQTVGCQVALATAGTRVAPPFVDFLSVSPHVIADTVQQRGDELKLVPGLNGLSLSDVMLVESWGFSHRFLQPLAGANVSDAAAFVLAHPGWRLTMQAHKVWGVA